MSDQGKSVQENVPENREDAKDVQIQELTKKVSLLRNSSRKLRSSSRRLRSRSRKRGNKDSEVKISGTHLFGKIDEVRGTILESSLLLPKKPKVVKDNVSLPSTHLPSAPLPSIPLPEKLDKILSNPEVKFSITVGSAKDFKKTEEEKAEDLGYDLILKYKQCITATVDSDGHFKITENYYARSKFTGSNEEKRNVESYKRPEPTTDKKFSRDELFEFIATGIRNHSLKVQRPFITIRVKSALPKAPKVDPSQ